MLPVNKPVPGFSMIELIVVLLVLALLSAVTLPNVFKWYESRQKAQLRNELIASIANLPLYAYSQRKTLIIANSSEFPFELPQDVFLTFQPSLIVKANGYCMPATLEVKKDQETMSLNIEPPYCRVK